MNTRWRRGVDAPAGPIRDAFVETLSLPHEESLGKSYTFMMDANADVVLGCVAEGLGRLQTTLISGASSFFMPWTW